MNLYVEIGKKSRMYQVKQVKVQDSIYNMITFVIKRKKGKRINVGLYTGNFQDVQESVNSTYLWWKYKLGVWSGARKYLSQLFKCEVFPRAQGCFIVKACNCEKLLSERIFGDQDIQIVSQIINYKSKNTLKVEKFGSHHLKNGDQTQHEIVGKSDFSMRQLGSSDSQQLKSHPLWMKHTSIF